MSHVVTYPADYEPLPPPPVTLPPLPARFQRRPYGLDEMGQPIKQTRGLTLVLYLRYLQHQVGLQVGAQLAANTPTREHAERIHQAQTHVVHELVKRLNAAIPEAAYHVTSEYLWLTGNNYSQEFSAYLLTLCRELSGDPSFFFNATAHTDEPAVSYLMKPLSLKQAYGIYPRIIAKFSELDLTVTHLTDSSATVRWQGARQIQRLPETLRPHLIVQVREALMGSMAFVPYMHSRLRPGRTRLLQTQLDGAPYDEWEVVWQATRPWWQKLFG